MNRLLLLILSLVACSPQAIAAPPLTITKSGYWLTIVSVDGVPTLQKIDNVTDLRVSVVPPVDPVPNKPVDPPKPPVVVVDKALAATIATAAKAVGDPAASQGLALVYSHVRDAYVDGILDADSVWVVLKSSTDAALITTATTGKDWKPFRTKLSDIITERKQQGLLSTKDQVATFTDSVKLGLEQSAEGSAAIGFDKVIAIVKSTNEAIDASR